MDTTRLQHNRYKLIAPIAEGTTGPVYRALDERTGNIVAIKFLKPSLFEQQQELVSRFEQEAEALRQLDHPNIVQTSDFFEEEGNFYLVMEYVEGGSLADRLRQGPLPLQRVLEIGLDLSDALARAHRLGIIHRDVKPQNVLLAPDGTPRLTDFGLAYRAGQQPASSSGDPAGTLHYMPPESFQGVPADERADIWSLGVLLYEMISGQLPFDAPHTGELIHTIRTAPAPDLRGLQPELPAPLADLINLMLARQRDDRIGSIRLVGAALEAIRNGRAAMLPQLTGTGSLRPQQGNLPDPPTSFIGRRQALEELVAQFSEPGGRLLTLTGPGGVGKTRLALQLAYQLRQRYPDGAFFVDLAPVTAPDRVASRIAQTLGIREGASRSLEQDIPAFFREKQCLLLLDNFEQIIEAAPLVSKLHQQLPQLDMLVTSREALRIRDEHVYQVEPLSLPDLARDASPVGLSQAESVDLFVQRAAVAQPGLRLTAENARDIAEICIQLDGLPLAIELAAARTRILPPGYLRRELGDLFRTLAPGPRDSVARQQTLRAAIDWSYDLLSEEEKALFASLSVFQGGATLAAIEAVCMPGRSIGLISGLESLVSKSLLLRRDTEEDAPRFRYLETIHQYASQRLAEGKDAETRRRRHAAYFVDLAQRMVPRLAGPEQEEALYTIRAEYDNLRAVLTWSLAGADPELGLKLVTALADFWYYEGSADEGKQWTAAASNWQHSVSSRLQARFLNGAGLLAFNRGEHQQGIEWNQQALSLARQLEDRAIAAWSLFWLSAHATSSPEQYEQGIDYCRRALALFHEVEDSYGLAWGYNQIGELSRMLADYQQAQEAYQRSLEICRQTGNTRREAIALVNLGYVAQHQGAYHEAEMYILEGMALLYHMRLVQYSAISLAILSGPVAAMGNASRAATLLGASEAVFATLSMPQQPADRMEIERYSAIVRQQMDDDAFQAAWAVGRAMSFDEAVAFAFLRATGPSQVTPS